MLVKKKLKVTKTLIAASFFITIIAIMTPVMAAGSNRFLFIAIGDDLDLDATNLIVGKIELDECGEPLSGQVVFHQRIYDSGEKVYTMKGTLKKGSLNTSKHVFYCPIFNAWWINVWWIEGEGKFKTTNTDYTVFFRNSMFLMMPNTEGKYIPATIFMWLSLTKEYYPGEFDNEGNLLPPPLGEDPLISKGESWVLAGVFWDTGIEMDFGYGIGIVPIGPVSNLTRYIKF